MAKRLNKAQINNSYLVGLVALMVGIAGILFTVSALTQIANPLTNQGSAANPHPLNLQVQTYPLSNKVNMSGSWTNTKSSYNYLLEEVSLNGLKTIQIGTVTTNNLQLSLPLKDATYKLTVACVPATGSACLSNRQDTFSFTVKTTKASLWAI